MKNKTKTMMMFMIILVVIAMAYVFQGISMHNQVATEEENFHQLQSTYWTQDKNTRDAAQTDSVLAKDLARLQQYPSQLLFLKLVGVGKILTGIFIILFGILIALISMPMRLGIIMKENEEKNKT